VASLVGKPIAVDEVSLIKDGPVRVKVECRNPSRVKGFVEVFFNNVGYELKFTAEGPQHQGSVLAGSSAAGNSDDKDSSRERGNSRRKEERKGGGRFDRKGKETEMKHDSSHGESQEDMENIESLGLDLEGSIPNLPIARFHPKVGLFSIDHKIPMLQKVVEEPRQDQVGVDGVNE
jgi:hypothetical protein